MASTLSAIQQLVFQAETANSAIQQSLVSKKLIVFELFFCQFMIVLAGM